MILTFKRQRKQKEDLCSVNAAEDSSSVKPFDGLSQEADIMCLATRCINCGSIEDSVVRANRLHPPAEKRAVPRRMGRVYSE